MVAKKFRAKLLKELKKNNKKVQVSITVIYRKNITVDYWIYTSNSDDFGGSFADKQSSNNLVRAINKCLPEINRFYGLRIKPLRS